MTVHLERALHWSARGLNDRRMALWCAYVLTTPAGAICHVGDSGYGDGAIFRSVRQRFGPVRLATLPIGAYEPRWFMQPQHMNPEEAIRVMREVGAEQALGHHWGTFRLTNEGIERPLEALAAALPAEGCRPSGSGRCGRERYGIPIVMAVPRLDPGIDPASRWVGARGKILWSSPEDDALRRVTSAARKCSARAPRRRRPLGR